jgi:decaprenylphospho-beta-D-ribofuranose 2-oxidase
MKWNRVYGRNGFIQYQVQIPLGKEEYFDFVLGEMRRFKLSSTLGVVKKFGNFKTEYLSFPSEGWTLSLDIPASREGLDSFLEILDKRLCEVGGKIYLTKDARISAENFCQMYPGSKSWSEIKFGIDPTNYWQSDQGRRLGLC